MVGASKILTVSYGTFSCTLEGFDDPFDTMRGIAEYFRDLAADDRYFGAEPPTPDAEMLHRIAEREVQRRVESRVSDDGIVLRQVTGKPLERPGGAVAAPAEDDYSDAEDDRDSPRENMFADIGLDESGEDDGTDADDEAEAAETASAALYGDAESADAMPRGFDETSVAAKLSRIRAVVTRDREATAAAMPYSGPIASVFHDLNSEDANVPLDDPAEAAEAEAAPWTTAGAAVEHEFGTMPEAAAADALAEVETEMEAATEAEDLEDLQALDAAPGVSPEGAPEADAMSADQAENEDDPWGTPAESYLSDDDDGSAETDEPAEQAEDTFAAAFDENRGDGGPRDDEDECDSPERPSEGEIGASPVSAPPHAWAPPPAPHEAPRNFAQESIAARILRLKQAALATGATSIDTGAAPEQDRPAAAADLGGIDAPADSDDEHETAFTERADLVEEDADDTPDERDENLFAELGAEADEDYGDLDEDLAGDAPDAARAAQDDDFDVDGGEDGGDTLDIDLDEVLGARTPAPEHNAFVQRPSMLESPPAPAPADDADGLAAMRAAIARASEAAEASSDYADDTDDGDDADVSGTDSPASFEVSRAGDAAFDRILEQTNARMDDSDSDRRRSAIAHLKAAVAATKADRLLKRFSRPEDEDREEQSQYRDDLAQVVRPTRPATRPRPEATDQPARPAGDDTAPLMLVSTLRVDGDRSHGSVLGPRRVTSETISSDEAELHRSFAEFAESMGATELPDLLEAAAAYSAFVEGQREFSRPQLMRRVAGFANGDYNREAGLRSFGQLLRQGKLQKLKRGQFTVTSETRFNPEARIAGE